MFLHLGGEVVVRAREVITILDYLKLKSEGKLKAFLEPYMNSNNVTVISEEISKSIVITDRQIYISPISSVTLSKRA